MPRITTFDTPALGLRPTETGITATANAARRVQGEYNEAAAAKAGMGERIASTVREVGDVATRAIDHYQINHGAAAFAGLFSAKEKEWNDRVKNADPNDPTIAQDFLENSVEPDLEKFKGAFTTERSQAWAEAHVQNLRQHLFNKTSADMATLAGEAAKVNVRQTVNSLSNTVRSDPTSLDFSLQTLESSVDGMVGSSPNLTGTNAARVRGEVMQVGKESIIKSAALGHIEKTGEIPDWVSDPKYSPYIKGDELKQFQAAAKYYQRANQTEARAARQDFEREARTNFHKDLNALEMSLVNDNGELVATKQHIAAFREIVRKNELGASLEPGRVSSMLTGLQRMVDRSNRIEAAKDDPGTRQDLTDRLFDPDNPTTMLQIGIARNDGKLGPQSARNLAAIVKENEAALKEPVFKTTMQGVKSLLGRDEVGSGKYASFVQDFLPQYMAAKRAGTLMPDALDIKNPESMISKAMKPYQRDVATIMRDRIMRGEPLVPQPTALPTVNNKVDFDKLPSGAQFLGSDGRQYRKP